MFVLSLLLPPEGLGHFRSLPACCVELLKGALTRSEGNNAPEKEVLLTEVETPFSLVTLRDSLVQSLLVNPMSDMAYEI